jgi:hypothetical protein
MFLTHLHNCKKIILYIYIYDAIDFQTLGLHSYEINRGMPHFVL